MTRRTLPFLIFLAFGATSSAQTIVLSPVALGGYVHTFVDGTSSSYVLRNDLRTVTTTFSGPPMTVAYTGWRAEFELPTAPPETRLVSATFEMRTSSGPFSQGVLLHGYEGSGVIEAIAPATSTRLARDNFNRPRFLYDVTGALGSGRFAGFDAFCNPLPLEQDGSTFASAWYDPTLTLTYAPVPEPASLAALGLGALGLMRRRKKA